MRLVRRRDGTREFQVATWREFRADWLAAPREHRGLFDEDRRPCVFRPAGADGQEPSYIAPHPMVWERVRARTREAMAQAPPRKRTRRCEACDTELTVARELSGLWVFRCGSCGSTEMFGKDVVGGTVGAGESEVRRSVRGVDLPEPPA
jgi:hypothetical protein